MRKIGELTLSHSVSKIDRESKRRILLPIALAGMFGALLNLNGCVGKPPKLQYTLAGTAIDYARQARAVQLAPSLWLEAEQVYRRAQNLYQQREYQKARRQFILARMLAERAENISRLKRFQAGEGEL